MKTSSYIQKKARRLITTAALAVMVMMLLITVVGVSSAATDEAALEPTGLATLGDFVWNDLNLDGERSPVS